MKKKKILRPQTKPKRATKPVRKLPAVRPVRDTSSARPISKDKSAVIKSAIREAKKPHRIVPESQRANVTAANQRYRAKGSDLDFDLPDAKLIAEREKYRFDLRLFCDEVVPEWFPLPHSDDQLFCIKELQRVAIDGGSQGIARSRGCGKTQQTKATALWAALFRHRRYIVPFAATAKFAKKNLNSMIKMLATSSRLRRLWPEIAIPIRIAYGKPNRSKYLTWRGNPLHLECSTSRMVFPYYEDLKEGVSVIECAGILEAARGLQFDTPNGETLRPDFLIGDDFQTKASAKSPEQCTTRIETIAGDFAQMGGPDVSVAIVLNCTVIETGDAADQLLDRKKHPALQGVRQKFVYEWPLASRPGIDDRKLEYKTEKDLWSKYMELRKQGMREGDVIGKEATDFYLAHRAAMDEGAKMGWDHKFVKKSGEHSAIQHAFNIIADYGEKVFAAEYQNRPLETEVVKIKLTADQVMGRCNGFVNGEIPPMSCIVTAFVDVNDFALSWGICAFTREMAGTVVAYGEWGMNGNGIFGQTDRADRIWDEKSPSPEGKERRFSIALDGLGKYLFSDGLLTMTGRNVRISAMLIDYGYNPRNVEERNKSKLLQNWCYSMQAKRLPVYPSRGWSSGGFPKPGDKTIWDSLSFHRKDYWSVRGYPMADGTVLKTVHHDAEFHRKEMQLSWLLPDSAPGSMTIFGKPGYGPGTDGVKHMTFAKQIAGAQLVDFRPNEVGNYSGLYRWVYTPGIRGEASDIVVGCRVAAMAFGYTQGLFTTTAVTPAGPAAPAAPAAPAPVPKMRVSPGWGGAGKF